MSKRAKFHASITVPDERIMEVFAAEDAGEINDRSSYRMEKQGGCVRFAVDAADPTALRAMFNGIMKNIIVYEQLKNGEGKDTADADD